MKILTVGGIDFAAKVFTDLALKKGHGILSIDDFYNNSSHSNTLPSKHPCILVNPAEYREVSILFQNFMPDVIVNFSNIRYSKNVKTLINKELNTIANLLEVMNSHKKEKTCLIHISSVDVYGKPDNVNLTEENLVKPETVCAGIKAASEEIALSYANENNLDVRILRMGNLYGPHQSISEPIANVISNCLMSTPVNVVEDFNEWLYIEDGCKGIFDAINRGKPRNIYNISQLGIRTSVLVELIGRLSGVAPEKLTISAQENLKDGFKTSFSKAEAVLGWMPETDLIKGLTKTIEWYRNNVTLWKE